MVAKVEEGLQTGLHCACAWRDNMPSGEALAASGNGAEKRCVMLGLKDISLADVGAGSLRLIAQKASRGRSACQLRMGAGSFFHAAVGFLLPRGWLLLVCRRTNRAAPAHGASGPLQRRASQTRPHRRVVEAGLRIVWLRAFFLPFWLGWVMIHCKHNIIERQQDFV